METAELVRAQRDFFETNKTKSIAFRTVALERLGREIRAREHRLLRALRQDLGKSNMEGYMAEIGLALSELQYVAAHMKRWAAKRAVPTPLSQFPSSSFQIAEPYGVVLVMSPWNYPFLLSIEPLIGALAAGNTVVLKPSAYAKAILHKLKSGEELSTTVPGNRPYRDWKPMPAVALVSDTCVSCGLCAEECPVQAIPKDAPQTTDPAKCILCMRCISLCPEQARRLPDQVQGMLDRKLAPLQQVRRENEWFL